MQSPDNKKGTYFSEEIYLEACGLTTFGLAIVQVISHGKDKLGKDREEENTFKSQEEAALYHSINLQDLITSAELCWESRDESED